MIDCVILLLTVLFTNPRSASDGKDYTGIDVVKTFNALESTVTHTIPILDDTDHENDEIFVVRMKPYSNVDIGLDNCTWTIKDDDCKFNLFWFYVSNT